MSIHRVGGTNQNLAQVVIGNVGKLLAVELGDDELSHRSLVRWKKFNPHWLRDRAYRMSLGYGADVEKGERLVALEELEAGDLTCIRGQRHVLTHARSRKLFTPLFFGCHTPLIMRQKMQDMVAGA